VSAYKGGSCRLYDIHTTALSRACRSGRKFPLSGSAVQGDAPCRQDLRHDRRHRKPTHERHRVPRGPALRRFRSRRMLGGLHCPYWKKAWLRRVDDDSGAIHASDGELDRLLRAVDFDRHRDVESGGGLGCGGASQTDNTTPPRQRARSPGEAPARSERASRPFGTERRGYLDDIRAGAVVALLPRR
jgi:hypothetical protein